MSIHASVYPSLNLYTVGGEIVNRKAENKGKRSVRSGGSPHRTQPGRDGAVCAASRRRDISNQTAWEQVSARVWIPGGHSSPLE